MAILEIKDVHVEVEDKDKKTRKKILECVNLILKTGEIHAIMGPNGTGKSTLSETIMGNPRYHITEGDILLNGESIINMPVDERARKGLFLAMQYPAEVLGVTNAEFLRAAINARRPSGYSYKASISRPESISSSIPKLGLIINICKISFRFFSLPEKPSFK